MKLIVNPHKIEIKKELVNEREIDITKCEFEFADEITAEYVKEAYFTFKGVSYKQLIINNECDIPNEVLTEKGQVEIGVVAYLVESEEEIKRYNPSPAYFNTLVGSLKENAENSEEVTPTDKEQMVQLLNRGLQDIENTLSDLQNKVDGGYFNGKPGPQGIPGEIGPANILSIGSVTKGTNASATITGTSPEQVLNLVLPKGDTGATGKSAYQSWLDTGHTGTEQDFINSLKGEGVVDVDEDINALDNRLTAIDGHIDMDFEKGNISIGTSGWGYGNSTTRVRTKQGTTIHLKPKDIIGLTDYTDARFYLGWKLPNGTYGLKGWNTADFVVSDEADYVVLLCNKTEKTLSSINELSDLFFIKVNDSLVNNAIDKSKLEKLGTSIYYWEKMINGSFNSATDKYVANATRLCIPEVLHTEDKIRVTADSGYRFAYHERNSSGGFVRDSGWQTLYDIPANSYFTMVFSRTDNANIGLNKKKHFSFSFADQKNEVVKETYNSKIIKPRGFIKSINHRGYNDIAPENTLPAFKLSKEVGFDYIETDISFTSDGVPVLLHDDTINRTSNGTGAVSSYTYEQLLEFDFGSWKSSEYTGTKIPTLEELLLLCKNLGLHAYLEIKPIAGGNSTTYITECVNLCKKYGMLRNVTWLSFNNLYLDVVKTLDKKARLGLLHNGAVEETILINNILALQTDYNDVFLNTGKAYLTSTLVEKCIENSISVEVWTVDFAGDVQTLNPIVSGVTSNRVLSDEFMYNMAMSNYEFKL